MQTEQRNDIKKTIDQFFTSNQRKDRNAIFLELTKSICPVCKKNIDAKIVLQNNQIIMRKKCSEHGSFSALLLSDAEWYTNSLKYNKPGSIPNKFNSTIEKGCPEDCGLCPNHEQHTCLAILEVTNRCNLSCSQCFAESSPNSAEDFISLDEVTKRLDNLIECEGRAEVVQISGGEPTIHPKIVEIIKLVTSKNVQTVMLNTNGIRLAQDDAFLDELANLSPQPSIYLQFDGFKEAFYKKFRGKELLDLKLQAIKKLSARNFKISLVSTIIPDENDDQVGEIINFAIREKKIRSVNFQPVFHEGRNNATIDPMKRITITDIFQKAEEQTDNVLLKSDFVPVPCPFPTCSGLTYVYEEEGKITPITRLIDVSEYLDFFKNKTLMFINESISEALKSLFSFSVDSGSKDMVDDFCCACGITLPRITELAERVTMIGTMGFMDGYTFDWKRAMKCCIHELRPDNKIIPFCVYNNIHRPQELAAQKATTPEEQA